MHILEGAVEGEIGVAEMFTLEAVVGGKTDIDGGIGVGGEVDADGGPVFPEERLAYDMPVGVGGVVGLEVGEGTGGDEGVGRVENLE